MKELFDKMGFESEEPLLNENATIQNIELKIDELRNKLNGKNEEEKKRNSESVVVFYFSGHGFEEKNGQQIYHYLCPYNFNKNKLSSTSINFQSLKINFQVLIANIFYLLLIVVFQEEFLKNKLN